jgi:hypothetical protein
MTKYSLDDLTRMRIEIQILSNFREDMATVEAKLQTIILAGVDPSELTARATQLCQMRESNERLSTAGARPYVSVYPIPDNRPWPPAANAPNPNDRDRFPG